MYYASSEYPLKVDIWFSDYLVPPPPPPTEIYHPHLKFPSIICGTPLENVVPLKVQECMWPPHTKYTRKYMVSPGLIKYTRKYGAPIPYQNYLEMWYHIAENFQGKIFTKINFTVLEPPAKVFRWNLGVPYPPMIGFRIPQKFSPQNDHSLIRESFLPWKFPAIQYPHTNSWDTA